MESSEHKTSPVSLEKSSSTKGHQIPIQESSEKPSSQLHYSSTMPLEFEQKKDNQADQIPDSEERTSQTDKKTSRKKLIRVASPQKEVSGEEYLQTLMVEREDQLKKSLSKRIDSEVARANRLLGEEERMKKSNEGNEFDQPRLSKEKSVKKSLKKDEHDVDSSQPKIIEERPPSVKRNKSSSRKFVESDDEEDKNKENPLSQFKHASDEPKREMTPNLRRTESLSLGSKGKDVSQNASSLDSSAKAIPNQEHSQIRKNDDENPAISKFLEEDLPHQTNIERKSSHEENVLDTSNFGSKKKSTQPIQTAITLEENFLDTSAFGSKKKSIHKEEIKADDTMNNLEKKALELQGIEKPSLSNFIENSAAPELEVNHEKPSGEIEDQKQDQRQETSPQKEKESSDSKMKLEPQIKESSESKMKLEPQIEIGENLRSEKKIERSPDKKEKTVRSGSSRKSSRLSEAKKAENFKIIVSPPPEDKEAQKRDSPKNKSPKRKSSLKPSSFNKDMNESQGERKSQNKSIVKFNEMIQISEIKNPVVYEDSPNNQRVTRSKFKEIPEIEEGTDSHKSGVNTRSKHRDNNSEEKKNENQHLEKQESKKSSRARKREAKESEKEEGEAISKKGSKSKKKSNDEESSGLKYHNKFVLFLSFYIKINLILYSTNRDQATPHPQSHRNKRKGF